MSIPTVSQIKREISWLNKLHLGVDQAARIVRQAIEYAETGRMGAALERYVEENRIYQRGDRRDHALSIMNKALETFGVEYIASRQDTYNNGEGLQYLNTGDPYIETIIYDEGMGTWLISTYGDLVEKHPERFGTDEDDSNEWDENPTDVVAVRELVLFIDNDGDLYRQMAEPIHKNLINKLAGEKYNRQLAHKAFLNLASEGAKRYCKQFCSRGAVWHEMFPMDVRRAAAEDLLVAFEAEAELGNYDNLLNKKYQRNPSMSYGQLPSPREFSRAFRAELGDGDYTYTFRGSDADVADAVGIPDSGRFDDAELWVIVKKLQRAFEEGNDGAGDLASSILYTLGFEWI